MGALLPNNSAKLNSVNISDRFYSGNSLFLRGFANNSIGSRQAPGLLRGGCEWGDIYGGLFKFNALAAVSAPIPVAAVARSGGRAFAFIGAGSVTSPPLDEHIAAGVDSSSLNRIGALASDAFRHSLDTARVSAGCGFSISIGPARVELTYSVPITKCRNDIVKPFQIGLGISIS